MSQVLLYIQAFLYSVSYVDTVARGFDPFYIPYKSSSHSIL
jgi:hypothetical protein